MYQSRTCVSGRLSMISDWIFFYAHCFSLVVVLKLTPRFAWVFLITIPSIGSHHGVVKLYTLLMSTMLSKWLLMHTIIVKLLRFVLACLSVRTALVALIAFMPSNPSGAIGSVDYPKEERRALATKSRESPPKYGSPERQKVIDEVCPRYITLPWEHFIWTSDPPMYIILKEHLASFLECFLVTQHISWTSDYIFSN